ncbi:replicative DNA helicase [Thermodesulfovibrio aggregans]|uniref:Replicative DNA helicase n=1 Tax=Thermodesulfovibrio aggregans TaxID=86166 RepID=A0A0U9HWR8_9BACT|nr:replicative DNA helicase [Thermodesulfovibrio aggregans]GAQ95277.1 replicative DNA helicase [Thermodesulfovibrio aggregans]
MAYLQEIESTALRLPPQSLEAEQAVLGAIILEGEAITKAIEILSPEDFYSERHRKIYQAMLELFDRNEPIDLITLTEHLRDKGELEDVGGVSYLGTLTTVVPTAANIRYHAKLVREKALLRSLIRACTEIVTKVYEEPEDAEEMIDFAERLIFEISEKRTNTSFYHMKDVVKNTFKIIESMYEKKAVITGIPSGFKDLDALTSGFQPGDLIIIGGRPGMGKTAFSLNIAQHVGVELGEPVAFFSLEMSKEQIAMRLLSSIAMVNSSALRKGFITKRDWERITDAAVKLSEAPIYIDDSSQMSVLEIRAKARRLKMEKGRLGLVIIDYLQLMRSRNTYDVREQEIADISRSLKAMAKELKVPVIALSQLNRSVEKSSDKRPTLANLRESGAIEQDADVIIFLYRDEVYNRKNAANKGRAEVIVAKQRNGPTDTVLLTFLQDYTRFLDYTDMYTGTEIEEEV